MAPTAVHLLLVDDPQETYQRFRRHFRQSRVKRVEDFALQETSRLSSKECIQASYP
jgi:hypothetical protein